jgi:hypothetical protein
LREYQVKVYTVEVHSDSSAYDPAYNASFYRKYIVHIASKKKKAIKWAKQNLSILEDTPFCAHFSIFKHEVDGDSYSANSATRKFVDKIEY